MEMFALDEDIAQFERALPPLRGAARLDALVPLAWYLRQRDTKRALALADEADRLLHTIALVECESQAALTARLRLVRCEAKWLFADLNTAADLAERALSDFTLLTDQIGIADAHWLLALIAIDRGEPVRRAAELEEMAIAAQSAGDAVRYSVADAATAVWAAYSDSTAALAQWNGRFSVASDNQHPAVAAWVNDYLGGIAFQASDFGLAANYWIQSREAALASGQLRRAILATTNIGTTFTSVNDHHRALEWMQRGLDLARPTNWPLNIGGCLMQTAETLRHLGRYDAAQKLLDEAIEALDPLARSRSYAIALGYIGDLALDRGDYAAALDNFSQLEDRADALQQMGFKIDSLRGQAHALCWLNFPDDALELAHTALTIAKNQHSLYKQIAVLKVLAAIHARHPLPPPEAMRGASAPLHYLQQALDIAAGIDGYTVSGDLLEAASREYANIGDHAQAYQIALQAIAAREKTHSHDATNRAIAMQVGYQTERVRAKAEHHRQLAEAEAKRAAVLQQTSATLEHLSAIGQEITAHLNVSAVFQALNGHVHGLLETNFFAIYLSDPDGLTLRLAFGIDSGARLPEVHIALSSSAISAQCARERREFVIDHKPDEDDEDDVVIPGVLPTLSALFSPLAIGDRVLGVMTVQSAKPHVYAEREQLIFRTLCAYGAIALDNANAYCQLEVTLKALREAQAQLVHQEKMASLGTLTAGVAHEINNPANFAHVGAQSLGMDLERFRQFLLDLADGAEAEILDSLNRRIDSLNSQVGIIVEGTTRIKNLVLDLRTFSRLDHAEKKEVNIADNLRSTVNLVRTQYSSIAEIHCELNINPLLECFPAELNQVFMNLIVNACQAIESNPRKSDAQYNGILIIRSRVENNWLVLEFEDNGRGIPQESMDRIFEPFFTTKTVGEGMGMGLSISFGIIEKHRGTIKVKSQEGVGTCFSLRLPLAREQADFLRAAA